MNTSSIWIVRMWRTLLPRKGSIARPSDRIQSGLLVFIVMIILAALPFAASIGSETFARQREEAAAQQGTRTPAMATLLADGPALTVSPRTGIVGNAQPTDATWTMADGIRRVGKIDAEEGAVKGNAVPIWLDQAGNPVDPPRSTVGAAIDAAGVGVGLWLAVLFVLSALYRLTVFVLNRFRYAQWQHEWFRDLDPQARP
ncbi:MAG TPA: hypothetical protein VJX66_13640 [Amycolatopsis sp.]|nr:hypothetical protein [Amycolatopsis sp.]